MKKLVIAADHAGFELKEKVKPYLTDGGWEVSDAGTYSDAPVDYPDFGCRAAAEVSSGKFGRGIVICGSGTGMAIVANKFSGIRAALCLNEEMARLSRKHNDANILALAGRFTDDASAMAIIRAWLETDFDGGRHQRRLDKIREWEEKLLKTS